MRFTMKVHKEHKPLKTRKNPLQEAFGKAVREKRIALKLSQEKLAELCDLHFTYISSVERGERNISLLNIAKIAHALNCSLKELVPDDVSRCA
jgi:transcriptional regulator with XRE-family HTH domain